MPCIDGLNWPIICPPGPPIPPGPMPLIMPLIMPPGPIIPLGPPIIIMEGGGVEDMGGPGPTWLVSCCDICAIDEMGSNGVDILLLAGPDEIGDGPMALLGVPPGFNGMSDGAPG